MGQSAANVDDALKMIRAEKMSKGDIVGDQ